MLTPQEKEAVLTADKWTGDAWWGDKEGRR